jgi:hypothetical protein
MSVSICLEAILGKLEGWMEYSVVKINNIEYHCFKKPKRFSSYKILVVRIKKHGKNNRKTFPQTVR